MGTQRFCLLLLIIYVKSGTCDEYNNKTEAVVPEPKNAFRFEDQPQSYGLIRFENDNLQQFDDNRNSIDNDGQRIKLEEENRIENSRPNHQKKKKRRRRPRQRLPNGNQVAGFGYPMQPGYPGPPYPGPFPYPGPPMLGPGPIYPGQRPYPAYPGPTYKPRPSATSAALSAVTEALTSIALYDDAQCVPRLLCEAAGGGSIPGTGLVQSVAGLQPLLTLLAAYNGISSSPLFVFGRAVFLGMTSKANPGTCRYAYSQCPNDPEQLVHYLNNHNGGFFRFFAAPELNQQQGLEQFYNQLSGQNYGLYQPQQNIPFQHNQNMQQGYGLQQNYPNQQLNGNGQFQQFGQYQNQNVLQPGIPNTNLQQFGYGQAQQQQQFNNQNYNQRPGLYDNGYGFYGQNYPYQQNFNQNRFKNNSIQKRIQNVRNTAFVDKGNLNPKWWFPGDSVSNNRDIYDNVRYGSSLKFPQADLNSNKITRTARGFVFPGIQSNREYSVESIESTDNDFFMEQKFMDDSRFYNQGAAGSSNDDSDNHEDRTLYIVRGNGDPNNPEIVHLAPGQTL